MDKITWIKIIINKIIIKLIIIKKLRFQINKKEHKNMLKNNQKN